MTADKKVEFAVFAPGFDPNVGGYVVLHQLCHYLNQLGHTAHMVPWFSSAEVSPLDDDSHLRNIFEQKQTLSKAPYTLDPDLNTPIYRRPWKGISRRDDLVVIYPEVVFGNPLRARNVARWLLHNPGFHNKNTYFVPGEVHFRYNEAYKPILMPWIEISEQLLTVMRIPWAQYKAPPPDSPRRGTAYLVRKGAGKPIVHDLTDSIQVDGMSHAEISDIFRRVKTFVSYDTYTLFSDLAVVAGADSVVVPDTGISKEVWQPDPERRHGLAYGFGEIESARASRNACFSKLEAMCGSTEKMVQDFAYFWQRRISGTQSNVSAQPSAIPDWSLAANLTSSPANGQSTPT